MKWKLHTRDESLSPHLVAWSEFDSKEAALDRACDTLRSQVHVKTLYIEGPDGKRIEYSEIEAWCKPK